MPIILCGFCGMKYWRDGQDGSHKNCPWCRGNAIKHLPKKPKGAKMNYNKNWNGQWPAGQGYHFNNQTYINNVYSQPKEECWETEVDEVKDCSKAPGHVKVWVKPLAKVKIDALMEKFPNIEWFAYLLSDDAEKEPHVVSDIFIPKQEVTATSVDNIECEEFNNLPVIGAIHSHHGMGTGFSGTDHAFVNQNHNISLVIAKNGVAGQVRWKAPCGAMKIVDAKVKPFITCEWDKEAFIKEEVEKIASKKYNTGANVRSTTTPTGRKNTNIPVNVPVKSGNGNTIENASADDDDEWNSGLTETASDDAPEVISTGTEDMSLMEALDEAFPQD